MLSLKMKRVVGVVICIILQMIKQEHVEKLKRSCKRESNRDCSDILFIMKNNFSH